MENAQHPREQVIASINRLKEKHPKELLTIEDLAAVVVMTADDDQEGGNYEDDAQWAEV